MLDQLHFLFDRKDMGEISRGIDFQGCERIVWKTVPMLDFSAVLHLGRCFVGNLHYKLRMEGASL